MLNTNSQALTLEDGQDLALNQSMTRVFGLMFMGLLVSAITAFFTLRSPVLLNLVFGSTIRMYIFMFAPLAFIIALNFVWKMSSQLAFFLFFAFATIMGMTLSAIFLIYDINTIALAFVSAAGMFGVMAIFGLITKKDLTRIGSLLIMALIGVIIASIGNIFFANSILDRIIPYVTIVIFLGLTAHDAQRIKKQIIEHMDKQGNVPVAVTIQGALHLYLDFLNLFLALLKIFGRRR